MRVATRASALARWQAEWVASALRAAHPGLEVTLVPVETTGDRRLEVPVWEMGGQGVFVKEVQAAVLDGRAEIAVHSAKDLPSWQTAGLVLAAVPPRGDPRDALVGSTLGGLAPGAVIATGSVRRRAQLGAARPDLAFVGVRGNIATRLSKVPSGGALVVAAAALARLGLEDRAAEVLEPAVMLPQVGQGAIAVECRDGDTATAGLLAAIDDPGSHTAVRAERSFLARLGSGCSLPVAAHATLRAGQVRLEGMIASLEGMVMLRSSAAGPAARAEDLGASLAGELLASGGTALLDAAPGKDSPA